MSKSHEAALAKNARLAEILSEKRNTFCGVGTRRVKLLLNKKMKDGDKKARIYRIALEAEDKNITAKESYWKYQERIYKAKAKLVRQLMEICRSSNIVYGWQLQKGFSTNTIVYFELPQMEQISFHMNLNRKERQDCSIFAKEKRKIFAFP